MMGKNIERLNKKKKINLTSSFYMRKDHESTFKSFDSITLFPLQIANATVC